MEMAPIVLRAQLILTRVDGSVHINHQKPEKLMRQDTHLQLGGDTSFLQVGDETSFLQVKIASDNADFSVEGVAQQELSLLKVE